MRCEAVREILEEVRPEAISGPVREHLSACADCAAYARDWGLLCAGFQTLKEEPAPKPMLGFAARLLRRLDEEAQPSTAEKFLEQVGRRVVYATLVLASVLLLALGLPQSGPLRGASLAELLPTQPEVTVAVNDPVFPYELPSVYELVPDNPAGGRENGER